MTTKNELTESVLKSKLIEFKEDHPHYLEEELSCFDDAVKLGFELGQKSELEEKEKLLGELDWYKDELVKVSNYSKRIKHQIIGLEAEIEVRQKSTKNPNMDKLAEYLVESIFECGDDDRGAVSRIELKIPNPDTGGEYSSGGFCRSALVNFIRKKLDHLNEQTNQGGEE